MSNYKMVDVEKSISIQHEQFTRFKTAYDYLNKITFMINGMNIDLLVGDIVSIMGISRVTNLILTRICISSLLPKRHGGLCKRNLNSNVFILDAGNSTDVYQFVDFMKQYGLDIKKTLQKIIVSRVFTIYQLIHFLVYELSKIIRKYNINLVVIPDLLEMFIQDPQLRMKEAKSLIREIAAALRKISVMNNNNNNYNVLLLASLPSNNELSSPILDVTHRIFFSLFNKEIEITENNTNDRLKLRMRERSDDDIHDITIKKHYSLSMEDLITITGR
ncbi:MAG: hypothetical protein WBY28_10780 [Nitrososphaeraceae archaeon]|jgi:hypothetical protein